jgi:translation initiation factor eIF-2B subunit delta
VAQTEAVIIKFVEKLSIMASQPAPSSEAPASEPKDQPAATATATPAPAAEASEPKLSGAELKKRAKAEKQAKRAAKKAETGPAGGPPAQADSAQQKKDGAKKETPNKKGQNQPQPKAGAQQKGKQQGKSQGAAAAAAVGSEKEVDLPVRVVSVLGQDNRVFRQFSIYRRTSLNHTNKDVHPAVLAFGLQLSSYQICGSTARCIGMLKCFKAVSKL